jgi:hypothetical protein
MRPIDDTKDHYIYAAKVINLAAGTTQSQIISIEADANFVAIKAAYFADIAGAPQTEDSKVVPLVNIQIQDSGSGRNLQNIPIPIDSLAGRGNLPFVFPIPREFSANSSLKISFENYSAATTYANVEFSLIGYKRFS